MASIKLGFTGSRDGMSSKQLEQFKFFILSITDKRIAGTKILEFHHGDCVGADKEAHDFIAKKFGNKVIHIHPPNIIKDRVFAGNADCTIYEAKPYLKRNKDIVDACNLLLAAPKSYNEMVRSGTWSTVRYAAKKKKRASLFLPNGDKQLYIDGKLSTKIWKYDEQ